MLPKLKIRSTHVLPTVYSDSLSYYEELNRIAWYINELIDEIGDASGMFEEINRKIAELQAAVADIVEEMENDKYYKVGDVISRGSLVASGVVLGSHLSTVRSIVCTVILPKEIPDGATVELSRQEISICSASGNIVGKYIEPDGEADSDLVVWSVSMNTNARDKLNITIGRRDHGELTVQGMYGSFAGGEPANVYFASFAANVVENSGN